MPELGLEINKAYDVWKSNPNEKSINNLLLYLEKAVPKYECKRKFDKGPVPAWWLADYESIDKWIDFLSSVVDGHYSPALKPFLDFYVTSDGYIAEEMTWQMIKVVRTDPVLILENWPIVRPYLRAVCGIRHMLTPEDIDEIVAMYDQISKTEPQLRASCLEIVNGLKEKVPEMVDSATSRSEALAVTLRSEALALRSGSIVTQGLLRPALSNLIYCFSGDSVTWTKRLVLK
jgi:hypothetical protein